MTSPTLADLIDAYNALAELQRLAEDSPRGSTAAIRTLGNRIITVFPDESQTNQEVV